MAERTVPERRGVARNLTLDYEASDLLREMASSKKTQGRFLSALVIAEAARREERRRLREVLSVVLQDPTSP